MTALQNNLKTDEPLLATRLEESFLSWLRGSNLTDIQKRERQRSFNDFLFQGIPDETWEDWKYSRPQPALENLTIKQSLKNYENINLKLNNQNITQLYFHNGDIDVEKSEIAHGVAIKWHARAFGLENHYPFSKFISAFANGYYEIGCQSLSANESISQIKIIWHYDDLQTNAFASVIRFNVSENMNVEIVEEVLSHKDCASIQLLMSDVKIEKNSHVTHVLHQNLATDAKLFHYSRADVEEKSTYKNAKIDRGGRWIRHDLEVHLNQVESFAELLAVYDVKNNQHVDHHTQTYHHKENTRSRQYYKGILDGQSRGVFNGRIIVDKDAQKISAEQLNKNLLVSQKARVYTKPELQISANDVKCTHGATVGQISADEIFYMQSRGIPYDQAKKILMRGFCSDVFLSLESESLRNQLNSFLNSSGEEL